LKVLNIHKRIINQPKNKVVDLINTLSTDNDKIWPKEKWPAMKFAGGIKIGAKGGHGPIKYVVEKYNSEQIIQFRFEKPEGFNGIHKFEIEPINKNETLIKHTIEMQTAGIGTLMWVLGIRSLHNALIEDCFDKIENNFLVDKKTSEWSFWVKYLRKRIGKSKKNQSNQNDKSVFD
jgi:hypothetical protein